MSLNAQLYYILFGFGNLKKLKSNGHQLKLFFLLCKFRSANDAYDFSGLNIIQWISMLQDLYEKFDYNDLDCQKRMICEVMKEPEYYGNMALKFKSGFQ